MLAIAEASLDIRDGERLLVCGAGGSGKTTLLNAASGIVPRLITPQVFGGDVTLNGKPISSMSKDELFSTVGVVSQNVEDQLWDLSVEDLIAFPLENRGLAKDAVRTRIDDLLNELELNALRGRRVLTLSGGERRMVAMAAALAAEPKLLILDEPTTGLDPAARHRTRAGSQKARGGNSGPADCRTGSCLLAGRHH
ncbi:ABC transporter ATP-binding protein [Ochrobactrum teleogrylli]